MSQDILFKSVPRHRLEMFDKKELIEFFEAQQRVNEAILRDNERLRALNEETKQKTLLIEEHYITLKNKVFGKSSEKEPSKEDKKKAKGGKKKKKVQLPSLRYPDAPLIVRTVEFKDPPSCSCCGDKMVDSGMTENSEYLTVIPAQFMVIRMERQKVRCLKCHGDIQTAPAPLRIKPGSSVSDELMIDISLSKYCDLIPIERYASIAGRAGLIDLPRQSLIERTHQLADFVRGAYDRLKQEILAAQVVHADETPHRMLEGDKKSSWYLWGFSTPMTSYFEIRDTRSGDVASELLIDSQCEYLVSDVFSGYGKAVRETNKVRKEKDLPCIFNVYCNAHARRKFKEAKPPDKEREEKKDLYELAQFFVDQYKKIYRLEKIAKGRPPDKVMRLRKKMKSMFQKMKDRAMQDLKAYSSKSAIGIAMKYFLNNYEELTLFTDIPILPIDNNPQERQLRNPVIGRKTWLGTHSRRGAITAAIHFSLVESCKLNKVNPRQYYPALVLALHQGKAPFTPQEFAGQ